MISKDIKLRFYYEMLLNRRFEERVNIAYTKQKFSGFCHLHIGQEALAVGVQGCLIPEDYMISGYRSHTQAIGKGITPKAVMAELFGKIDGCSRGKGGSMHMFSSEHRFLGGHGIVGGQAPLAVGAAFTSNYLEEQAIVVCYLGDAAMNQGQVFEAMNMAATWCLPTLFVIENNQYGMGTAITRTTSVDKLSKRALAFDMDNSEIDAMDVLKVFEHTNAIVKRMRESRKPHLMEAHTYRYKGHSVSDPAHYRTKEEVNRYQELDPIRTLGESLQKDGVSADELKEIDKKVKQEVKEAEAFADASKVPDLSVAFEDVLV